MSEQTVGQVLEHAEEHLDAGLDRLGDVLRIPSISTDPAYRDDCRRAAEWCAAHLRQSGLEARLDETGSAEAPGHPVVIAHTPGPVNYEGPHVLFYGHYDVQPPDPLDLWDSPPFEPTIIRDDRPRIVARGAVDDKGQAMMFLEALRAWKDVTGEIPIKLTVMLEGEEEVGSLNLHRYVEDNAATLRECDICVVSDTGMWDRDTPAITYSLRGMAYCEAILHGPNMDLHSGGWGGCIPNPANELMKMFAGLFGPDGRCTLPGFYDAVIEVGDEERAAWSELGFDEARELDVIGLGPEASVGETGYTLLERQWARPTCDVNGIYGGYMGEGAKTIIPSFAGAKISFRLVPDQDPASVTSTLEAWLRERTPPGCRLEFRDHASGVPCRVPTDSPYLTPARRALEIGTGRQPILIGSGGSIPVVGSFKSTLGLDSLLIGFGLSDDRVHSPNEKFELHCYRWGLRTHIALLDELSRIV
jgi:acetylornithine deacetylase/succinyl-diaminopimelate desuccinylase-like protein